MAEEKKKGAPAWMVSFGDMMTLILTFFILMVSLSKEQQEGLVAKGVGSFVAALRSFGLPGLLSESERAAIFQDVRVRFNLPPEEDPERREEHAEASNLELIRAKAARSLAPHDELNQPAVAVFRTGSAELDPTSRRYLDLLVLSLTPGPGAVLILEGHASESEGENRLLAFERAHVVARYLIETHGIPALRVEPRAWLTEIDGGGTGTRSVDARLVVPAKD